MRIMTITGSRSDRNAVEAVYDALEQAGHTVDMCSVARPGRAWPSTSASGDAVKRVADAVDRFVGYHNGPPELVFVHGDRHEIVGAALGANLCGIPVAHLGGGDMTVGSQDDKFRRSITALSHLHFVNSSEAANRVTQMGETTDDIYVVGCPGIDFIVKQTPLTGEQLWRDIDPQGKLTTGEDQTRALFVLVVLHPATINPMDTLAEATGIAAALNWLPDVPVVLVGPNSDSGWAVIDHEWNLLAANRKRTVYHHTLDPREFLTLLKECAVLVGNSSAAYYEAPYFGKVAVDIGRRQLGRFAPRNIVACPSPDPQEVKTRIEGAMALSADPRGLLLNDDYYGDGRACERIVKVVAELPTPTTRILGKPFRDLLLGQPIFRKPRVPL